GMPTRPIPWLLSPRTWPRDEGDAVHGCKRRSGGGLGPKAGRRLAAAAGRLAPRGDRGGPAGGPGDSRRRLLSGGDRLLLPASGLEPGAARPDGRELPRSG